MSADAKQTESTETAQAEPTAPQPPAAALPEPYLVVSGSDPVAFLLAVLWAELHSYLGDITPTQEAAMGGHAWLLQQSGSRRG